MFFFLNEDATFQKLKAKPLRSLVLRNNWLSIIFENEANIRAVFDAMKKCRPENKKQQTVGWRRVNVILMT